VHNRHFSNRTVVFSSNMNRYVWQGTGPGAVNTWYWATRIFSDLVQINWKMFISVVHCECLFTSTFHVLARINRSSSQILQSNISDSNKLSFTSGAVWKTFFAASTYVVSVFTHLDWRCHVLQAYRTLQFV